MKITRDFASPETAKNGKRYIQMTEAERNSLELKEGDVIKKPVSETAKFRREFVVEGFGEVFNAGEDVFGKGGTPTVRVYGTVNRVRI